MSRSNARTGSPPPNSRASTLSPNAPALGGSPTEYGSLEALFGALVCAPADAAIGRRAGDYLRRYQRATAWSWAMHSLPQRPWPTAPCSGPEIANTTR